jgi:hypothetical protein
MRYQNTFFQLPIFTALDFIAAWNCLWRSEVKGGGSVEAQSTNDVQ